MVSTQRKGMMFWARHILQSIYNKESSLWGFPGDSVVKPPPANAGDAGLIPGSGRSPGAETATYSSILAWEIPQTEEPGGLQSRGCKRVRHGLVTKQQQHSSPNSHLAQAAA